MVSKQKIKRATAEAIDEHGTRTFLWGFPKDARVPNEHVAGKLRRAGLPLLC